MSVLLGISSLSMCLLHLISPKVLTYDFSDHEHQADGRGYIELTPGLPLLGVTVNTRTFLSMAVMIALHSQLNGLQVQTRSGQRDPASPLLPQRSRVRPGQRGREGACSALRWGKEGRLWSHFSVRPVSTGKNR